MFTKLASAFLVAAAVAAMPLAASADDHDHHVAEAGSIRVVHPWARAAEKGANTLVFMEIENAGAADELQGGRAELAQAVRVVGFVAKDGVAGTQEVGAVEVPAVDFHLDPGGLALELVGLREAISQGGHFARTLSFRDAGELTLHVDVEAATASQHSHAGHAH